MAKKKSFVVASGKKNREMPNKKKQESKSVDDSNDEIVTVDTEVEVEHFSNTKSRTSELNKSEYSGGYVHTAFRNAICPNWRRTAEAELFYKALKESAMVSGASFGSIITKTSFVTHKGGAALF